MAESKEFDCESTPFTVSMDSKIIPASRTGQGPVRLIFTHGAGGTVTTPAMVNFSAGFSKNATASVICFQGNTNLKSRVKMFGAVYDNTSQTYQQRITIALGGRSMGARAAVLAATEDTKYLILASYPLQTDKDIRDQILLDLPVDKSVLFISGDHDSMCDLSKLNEVRMKMKAKTWLIRVRDADHGMNVKPKKATVSIGEKCGILAAEWLCAMKEGGTDCEIWWGEDDQGNEEVHSTPWKNSTEPASDETKAKPVTETKPPKKKAATVKGVPKGGKGAKAAPKRRKGEAVARKSEDKVEGISEPAPELRRSKRRKV